MHPQQSNEDSYQSKQPNQNLEEVVRRLSVLETDVRYIRKWLDAPHVCKWNGKIGELIEFKVQTEPIRANIFKRLDEDSAKINSLEDTIIALDKGREILEEIKSNQEDVLNKRTDRRIRFRDALLLLVVGGAITIVGGVILDIIRSIV